MKLMKRSLIFISILGLFIAFLFLLTPRAQIVNAATTAPPGTNTTQTTTQAPSTTPTDTSSNTASSTTSTIPKAELTVSGLTANDAVVTDMSGNPIQPSDNLYTWLNFNVNYNWSIPDDVKINAGDTVPFELPSGLVTPGDMSFPIYDSNNVEIGIATIKAGEASGTITFNDVLSNTNANRHGTLKLVAKGTNTGTGNEGQNWMYNKNGWIAGYDPTGVPNELTWNLALNPNEHNLNNVVLTDILGPNQEYIPGSLTAIAGSYVSGGFVSNGQELHPTVTTDGNKVIISFPGTLTTAVDIYYRVKITGTPADGTTTWTNHATMGSSEDDYSVDSSTSWGGSGTGNGDQNVGTMTLTKTDATTGAPLAGAEYELKDSDGNVIISNAKTDENGQIVIKNLNYGSYTLTEVRAPDGYTLNPTPINFTLPDNGVINLTTDQKDTAETGAVVLKKVDPDTKDTIAGTTFNLLDKNGNIIKEGLVTDGNGEISVDNLPAGEYQFVETQPAEGYVANTTPIEFTVVAGQTTPVELEKFNTAVTVTPDTGNVTLDKVDSVTGKFLPGAIYDLLDSNDNVIQSGLTTDENGQIKITDLPVGSYYFIETNPPEGYQDNLTPIEFFITQGQDSSVTAKDEAGTTPEIPGEPEPPVEPGTPEPPIIIPNPGEPGTTEPPGEPGTPEPPVTNPGEPGTTEPPVEPGTPEPPVTTPIEPQEPQGPTEPVNPEIPSEIIPPVYPTEPTIPTPEIPGEQNDTSTEPETPNTSPSVVLPSTGNNGNPSYGLGVNPGSNSGLGYGQAEFPQTGNQNNLLMIIGGFFIALFVLLKHMIKKLNY
ncbi:SpaA isopeptide-forming pilin-related protein [Companilactobacillus mindensis]|nr:SpaA isopeptide-forming pilin-related protein [Companilactobacillus mindensis]GEO79774.1 hypothetical protein LMI01_21050 [Companilactobacillus mindensis]